MMITIYTCSAPVNGERTARECRMNAKLQSESIRKLMHEEVYLRKMKYATQGGHWAHCETFILCDFLFSNHLRLEKSSQSLSLKQRPPTCLFLSSIRTPPLRDWETLRREKSFLWILNFIVISSESNDDCFARLWVSVGVMFPQSNTAKNDAVDRSLYSFFRLPTTHHSRWAAVWESEDMEKTSDKNVMRMNEIS